MPVRAMKFGKAVRVGDVISRHPDVAEAVQGDSSRDGVEVAHARELQALSGGAEDGGKCGGSDRGAGQGLGLGKTVVERGRLARDVNVALAVEDDGHADRRAGRVADIGRKHGHAGGIEFRHHGVLRADDRAAGSRVSRAGRVGEDEDVADRIHGGRLLLVAGGDGRVRVGRQEVVVDVRVDDEHSLGL